MSYRRLYGWTLIELVVTLAIISLIVGLSAQGIGTLYANSLDRTLLGDLHTAFAYARTQAIQERHIVTLCPLDTAQQCTNNWSGRISVFPDADNNRSPDDGIILRHFELPDRYDIRARPSTKGYFQFTGRGLSHGSLGSLVICRGFPSTTTHLLAYVSVNLGGRYKHQLDRDNDGSITIYSGKTVDCSG